VDETLRYQLKNLLYTLQLYEIRIISFHRLTVKYELSLCAFKPTWLPRFPVFNSKEFQFLVEAYMIHPTPWKILNLHGKSCISENKKVISPFRFKILILAKAGNQAYNCKFSLIFTVLIFHHLNKKYYKYFLIKCLNERGHGIKIILLPSHPSSRHFYCAIFIG